ncbi:hypothetical protein GIB67_025468 [Kingdonia uniflora]|uniref:Uncharacterized protein n=1 Tax=Kingdonia uniflora TaxID=39325 RepID=A0A7J7LX17_9MAGN|nr:hypothetical protein GIB67_025468 [Kingdonia uniflora]
MGTYVHLFDLKVSSAVHSTKSQRHNIFVSRLKKYLHKYSWIIRSRIYCIQILEDILY